MRPESWIDTLAAESVSTEEKPTEGLPGRSSPSAEEIFARFVRRANADEEDDAVTHVTREPVPLVRRKVSVDLETDDTQELPALTDETAKKVVAALDTGLMKMGRVVRVVEAPAANEQKRERAGARPAVTAGPHVTAEAIEARRYVPDVARVAPPPPPVAEGSEDGQIPAGQLERELSDMQVLLRHDHRHEVRQKLEELVRRYPEDLLLLRRIAEFHLENDDRDAAIEMLFLLAGRLFERRNVAGMRQALEQVLVLDPKHRRAYKLLGLLEQRPDTGTG